MLGFEIGQREGGFYSARTDGQTDTPTTVLVYRFNIKYHHCREYKKMFIQVNVFLPFLIGK